MIPWIIIGVCVSQSAMFSGLNLAVFGISRLRLEVEAKGGNPHAARVLSLREDSNYVLTTILWGNVAANTLLALVADSVMTGVGAFLFSTIVITFLGEIVPQAWFSRNALRVASFFCPVLRFYQILLLPVARPTARLLDRWLGPEGVRYFREEDFREIIRRHMDSDEADVGRLEGIGAINFLELDDVPAGTEGELVAPDSVLELETKLDLPVFPEFSRDPADPFLRRVNTSGRKWVVLTDTKGKPQLLLDADGFLRTALLGGDPLDPYAHCHRPLIIEDPKERLGDVILRLRVEAERPDDDVIDRDVLLVWGDRPRVITGADLLGRLMRGIVPVRSTD